MKKEAFRVKLVKIAGRDCTEGRLHSAFVFTVDAALSTSQALHTIKKEVFPGALHRSKDSFSLFGELLEVTWFKQHPQTGPILKLQT